MKISILAALLLVSPVLFAQQGGEKIRVAVLDFTTIDVEGQKRFLNHQNQRIDIPRESTLNMADHQTMNSIMQGYVRMIDAWDNSETNTANRIAQIQNNDREYAKTLELYRIVVKGEMRPVVIGAEYLSAYLGKHNDVFAPVDAKLVGVAMEKLAAQSDFPKDFMRKLAEESGATHLIYGTVSDMRTKEGIFKGYGIETRSLNYQLDVILKVVDLRSQSVCYSNMYTGTYREQLKPGAVTIDHNKFQTLMTSALEQASEDIYEHAKPGPESLIKVHVPPVRVIFAVDGGKGFKPDTAMIYLNGQQIGDSTRIFDILPGTYRIEIKAPGYKTQALEATINADQAIKATLEK